MQRQLCLRRSAEPHPRRGLRVELGQGYERASGTGLRGSVRLLALWLTHIRCFRSTQAARRMCGPEAQRQVGRPRLQRDHTALGLQEPNQRRFRAQVRANAFFRVSKAHALTARTARTTRSANATAWGHASCPAGFDFAVPLNGYENSQLAAVLRAGSTPSSSVWLNRLA